MSSQSSPSGVGSSSALPEKVWSFSCSSCRAASDAVQCVFTSRKDLSNHCRDRVAAGVDRAHRRRVYEIPFDNVELVQYRA